MTIITGKKSTLQKTAVWNDLARTAPGVASQFIITNGVAHLPMSTRTGLIEKMQTFTDFNENNDPYGEHDFGKIEQDHIECFWKIDDYGNDFKENGATHRRVLTLMLTSEY